MPLIDPSIVLSSPMFQTTFAIIRVTESVDDHGMAVNGETRIDGCRGVIAPSSNRLNRTENGERIDKETMSLHTKVQVRTGGPGATADIVEYKGARYTVVAVNDMSEFGSGWYHAIMELLPLNP